MKGFIVMLGLGLVCWLGWAVLVVCRIRGTIDAPWLLLLLPVILVALFVGGFCGRSWMVHRRELRRGQLIRRFILEGKLCVRRRQEQTSLCVRTPVHRGSVVHTDLNWHPRTPFRDRQLF